MTALTKSSSAKGSFPNRQSSFGEDDLLDQRASASPAIFADLREGVRPQSPLRAAVTSAYRRPEEECVAPLLYLASQPPDVTERVAALARDLVKRLRNKARSSGVEGLIHEYSLSSQEGIALMCLAEALLRIPDAATRDALIRDKISAGDWRSHVGHSPSLFVNAATWGLVVTGRLTTTTSEMNLSSALTLSSRAVANLSSARVSILLCA
jgi:RHH-type proline utilization regulon transcriptional repressor/proline dehydrogenase/delta 1-pyrroline-5-carboxylate dehydrogenase